MSNDPSKRVSTDLVEYFIVAVPAVDSLGLLSEALVELVERAAIRVLDAVVLVKDVDGAVTALELDAVEGLAGIRHLVGDLGGILSEHDLGLAATALRSGSTGVVLVTEDRWAEPLSVAAHLAGGQIIAGERIPALRIESALAEQHADDRSSA